VQEARTAKNNKPTAEAFTMNLLVFMKLNFRKYHGNEDLSPVSKGKYNSYKIKMSKTKTIRNIGNIKRKIEPDIKLIIVSL
jgi:hypothetical protein